MPKPADFNIPAIDRQEISNFQENQRRHYKKAKGDTDDLQRR